MVAEIPARFASIAIIALSLAVFMACADTAQDSEGEPTIPPFPGGAPPEREGEWEQIQHPDKEALGNYSRCENWREELPLSKRSWDAPWTEHIEDPDVRETLETFFAAQFPVDGKDYQRCVVAEMFSEIELYAGAIRAGYFGMPPEAQSHRGDLINLLGTLFEEPLVLELLTDIILQPYPEFDSEYLQSFGRDYVADEENFLRFLAIEGLRATSPDDEDVSPWQDSLLEVVIFAPYQNDANRHVALAAAWTLRDLGVSKSEFGARVGRQIPDENLNWLVENAWPD